MKRAIAILFALLLAFGAAACQTTPESPIVVQKDFDKLIEKANQAEPTGEEHFLADRLNAPETLQMQLASKGGNLQITVDALVVLPNVEQLPMIRVGHGRFDGNDARRFAEVLFGDAMPLDPFYTPQTKGMIQKSLDVLMTLKERGELDKYETMKDLDNAISELIREMADAPDSHTPSEHVFEWKASEPYLMLRAAPDAVTVSDLSFSAENVVYIRNLSRYATMSAAMAPGIPASNDYSYKLTQDLAEETGYTPEEAYTIALDAINALQVKDMVCTARRGFRFLQDDFSLYEFAFTRSIAGIPITFTNDEGSSFEPREDGTFAEPWPYERIRVFIDETGVAALTYTSPYVILETVSESVSLLPFPEILKIFERMAPMVNDWYDYNGIACNMRIHEVRLGLMRIMEQNSRDTGPLVPVWDFMGTSEFVDKLGDSYTYDDTNISILTINAIDGSIIDRGLGY